MTPWRLAVGLVAIGASLAGFAFTRHGSPAAAVAARPLAHVRTVDDAPETRGTAFRYSGRWEHVAGFRDGRTQGTSSRSFSRFAASALDFTGTAIRLYGVCGASGGRAIVALDGRIVDRNVRFSKPAKETHCLVFERAGLPRRRHRLGLIVVGPDGGEAEHSYVNIDGADYDS